METGAFHCGRLTRKIGSSLSCLRAGAAATVKAEVEGHIRATIASKGAQITVLKQVRCCTPSVIRTGRTSSLGAVSFDIHGCTRSRDATKDGICAGPECWTRLPQLQGPVRRDSMPAFQGHSWGPICSMHASVPGRDGHGLLKVLRCQAMRLTASRLSQCAQGYLLKKSTGIRREWKRRFFVLDSSGMLYYYSNKVLRLARPPARLSIATPIKICRVTRPAACCTSLQRVGCSTDGCRSRPLHLMLELPQK